MLQLLFAQFRFDACHSRKATPLLEPRMEGIFSTSDCHVAKIHHLLSDLHKSAAAGEACSWLAQHEPTVRSLLRKRPLGYNNLLALL